MNCKYHPTKEAAFHCHLCDVDYCLACSDQTEQFGKSTLLNSCLVCGADLDEINADSRIEPFWARLNSIYLYPLHTQSLIAIVVLALMTVMFRNWGLFVIIPAIAICLYAFACLRSTAAGEADSPGIEETFTGSIGPVFSVLMAIVAAALIVSGTYKTMGVGFGILMTIFVTFCIPAMIIIIAIEERLGSALNPGKLISIIKTTGAGYFVMVLFVIVMLSSMGLMLELFGNTNFVGLSIFLTALIGNYYQIVIFHILGYLVYQNHSELGFRITGEAGVKESIKRTPEQRFNAKLAILMKAGRLEDARTLVRKRLTPESLLPEWNRAFKVFTLAKPIEEIDTFFVKYLQILKRHDQEDRIADTYLALKKVKPEFSISDPSIRLDVADSLISIGKAVNAVALIKTLHKDSEDEDIVGRTLATLGKAFDFIPGSENHAEYFKTQHALHETRIRRRKGEKTS